MVLNSLLVVHGGKWMHENIPTSQSKPEIKYLLHREMCGKGSLLAKPLEPLGTPLARRTLFWRTCFQARVSGSEDLPKSQVCAH